LAAEEPPLPFIQPIPQEQLFQQRLVEWEIAGPQRPAERARTIPLFNQPGSGLRYPSDSIFPPLVTKTPARPAPSVENLLAPWHCDLLYDTSTSLVILLQKGKWKMVGWSLYFKQSMKDSIRFNLGDWMFITAIWWITVWATSIGYTANL
jgi:hypothetical protein